MLDDPVYYMLFALFVHHNNLTDSTRCSSGRALAWSAGGQGSVPSRVIPKTLKMVLSTLRLD